MSGVEGLKKVKLLTASVFFMPDLHRIVELQAKTITRETTDTQAEYDYIEKLIETGKPPIPETDHHYLIRTPFRYPLPVPSLYQARFKPPFYFRNCFYGTYYYRTAVFEMGYHWLKQRVHIKGLSQTVETRTHFKVSYQDDYALDILRQKNRKQIMNRHDYSYSHQFVLKQKNPPSSILYPSCRDPQKRICAVVYEIATLGKKPRGEKTLHLIYHQTEQSCWIEPALKTGSLMKVRWEEVN